MPRRPVVNLVVSALASEVMDTLTRRVRVLTRDQLREFVGDSRSQGAKALIRQMEAAGVVATREVLARPVLALERPVCRWRVGDSAPDFGKVSYQLKSRWREAVIPTEIVVATKEATRRYGGYQGGRWPRSVEISHDLHLASVFLWYRVQLPAAAASWVSETQLYAEGGGKREHLPDAVIRRGDEVQRVVEFGGSYGKQKLEALHREWSREFLEYEIW